jgi:hypothetical protein
MGPAEVTYYFPIPFDKCNPTGVFFPAGYGFPGTINVILYFHGHKLGEFETINQYWSGNLHHIRFREDINDTGKQVVLIAPTMGAYPGSSLNADMGIFQQAGAGDTFLAEVAKWIGKYVPQYASRSLTPSIGNIVLAGHSGAGGILSQQAKTMKSPICEVWGFDSMYGQGKDPATKKAIDVPGEWETTAESHAQPTPDISFEYGIIPTLKLRQATQFYFYWAGSGPGANSKDLQERVREAGLNNVHVEANVHTGALYHFETLTANFKKRVAAARCL